MKHFICSLLLITTTVCTGQNLYFPPNDNALPWDTVSPQTLGWCEDSIPALFNLLGQNDTKGFILLKEGRIALEKYYGTFTKDSLWYWASAGKTMTAFLTGMAQQEGHLSITDTTSTHLGAGWTNMPVAQEEQITIRHQLTMTTGLDDGVASLDCTDPICLNYLAPPGTRWSYHNAPYTLLTNVIENATGTPINLYLNQKLNPATGFVGFYVPQNYNRVMFSTPRNMARFGLLMLANGTWNGNPVLTSQNYLQASHTPSQTLNNSYGYLWWLNGQADFMLPSTQFVFSGPLVPNGPGDMYCGLGKNDQMVCVVPSEDLVMVRMGNQANGAAVSVILLWEIWEKLNDIRCLTNGLEEATGTKNARLWPNPANERTNLQLPSTFSGTYNVVVRNINGQEVMRTTKAGAVTTVSTTSLANGAYFVEVTQGHQTLHRARLLVAH